MSERPACITCNKMLTLTEKNYNVNQCFNCRPKRRIPVLASKIQEGEKPSERKVK